MILFITNKDDITTDFIINKLNKKKIPYYRFNTEELLHSVDLLLDLSGNTYKFFDKKQNKTINFKDIKSVYYRRPKLPATISVNLSNGEECFVQGEISATLEGIYKLLEDKFWVSSVFAIRNAENKIYQLKLAKELDIAIPSSLITTLKEQAQSFFNYHDMQCIVKPIKTGFIDDMEEPKVIFTNQIKKQHKRLLNAVQTCPTFFQNKIDKTADIRVTVVGKKFFVAKINSQEFETTKIDWRDENSVNLRYEKLQLPSDIKSKCIELMSILNLEFAAIDFVLDNNKQYIFLEVNPNGQWAWIEKRLSYNISGALIDHLIKKGNESVYFKN